MDDKEMTRRALLTSAGVVGLVALAPSADAAQQIVPEPSTGIPYDPKRAGELHHVLLNEFLEAEVGKAKGVVSKGVEKLKEFDLIAESDALFLNRIIDDIINNRIDLEKIYKDCDDLKNNDKATPVVRAIAGIIRDSFRFMVAHKLNPKIVMHDVAGAITGTVAGYRWGLYGALIGALAGGGAGSVIAYAERRRVFVGWVAERRVAQAARGVGYPHPGLGVFCCARVK